MEKEIWKDVVGYEGLYKVSNLGRVKSLDRTVHNRSGDKLDRREGKILSQCKRGRYLGVDLSKNGVSKSKSVHRIVARAFLKKTKFNVVNHIDHNGFNNRVDNLEWCTHKHNSRHMVKSKRQCSGEKVNTAKLTRKDVIEILLFLDKGFTQEKIASLYPVTRTQISSIKRGKSWKCVFS